LVEHAAELLYVPVFDQGSTFAGAVVKPYVWVIQALAMGKIFAAVAAVLRDVFRHIF